MRSRGEGEREHRDREREGGRVRTLITGACLSEACSLPRLFTCSNPSGNRDVSPPHLPLMLQQLMMLSFLCKWPSSTYIPKLLAACLARCLFNDNWVAWRIWFRCVEISRDVGLRVFMRKSYKNRHCCTYAHSSTNIVSCDEGLSSDALPQSLSLRLSHSASAFGLVHHRGTIITHSSSSSSYPKAARAGKRWPSMSPTSARSISRSTSGQWRSLARVVRVQN